MLISSCSANIQESQLQRQAVTHIAHMTSHCVGDGLSQLTKTESKDTNHKLQIVTGMNARLEATSAYCSSFLFNSASNS